MPQDAAATATAADPLRPPPFDEALRAADRLQGDGHYAEALAVLLLICTVYPDSSHAAARACGLMLHLGRLDPAARLIEAGLARFPQTAGFLYDHARLAERRRDLPAAAERWQRVRERFPEDWQGYTGGAAALRDLGHVPEAEQILADAAQRFADRFEVAVEYARLANARRDWLAAAERWGRVRAAFPDRCLGQVGAAQALREAGRLDEAEAVLDAAVGRWPDDRDVLFERARAAVERRDFALAASRWAAVLERDPEFWPAAIEGARSLRELGRSVQADAVLDDATLRLRRAVASRPADHAAAVALARLLGARPDWPAAVEAWLAVRPDSPHQHEARLGAAVALRQLGRFDEAAALLAAARAGAPQDRGVILEQLSLAYAQEDWPAAAALCAEALRLWPEDSEFARRAYEIRLRVVDAAGDMTAIPEPPAAAAADTRERDLMLRFESLGGTGHGCEFGIYQRACGAEPLGLLRWTDLTHDNLTEALESTFAGVGTPEQTLVFIPPSEYRRQYWTRDKRFFMVSGTNVYVDEAEEAALFPQLCRRLQFLRRKLIDDLHAAEKIFVYKNQFRDLTGAELDRLWRALRAYGETTLFYLRYADAAHPDGSVEWTRPGLLQGYIRHFTCSPQEVVIGKPYDSFRKLTHAACALFDAGQR